jgi:hypothetical protein
MDKGIGMKKIGSAIFVITNTLVLPMRQQWEARETGISSLSAFIGVNLRLKFVHGM